MKKDRRQYFGLMVRNWLYWDFNSMNVNLGIIFVEKTPGHEDLYDLTEHLCGYDVRSNGEGCIEVLFFDLVLYKPHNA